MVGLRQLIEHGAVVAATDYPGLGYRRTAPYLVGDSEARAVIASVRAARSRRTVLLCGASRKRDKHHFARYRISVGANFVGLRSRVGRQLGTALLMPRLHKIS